MRQSARALSRAAIAALMLSGCAPLLSAEAPLFSPADQIGPAPFTEGVWMQDSSACAETRRQTSYSTANCTAFELSTLRDGAWLLEFSHPSTPASEATRPVSLRVILAPATEQTSARERAPLYLAEYVELGESGPSRPSYLAVSPVGALPARAFYLIPVLCSDALRDPPIAGVSAERDDEGRILRCAAESQSAVREAVRRATIAHLDAIQLLRFTWRRRSHRVAPDLLVDCPLPAPATSEARCAVAR